MEIPLYKKCVKGIAGKDMRYPALIKNDLYRALKSLEAKFFLALSY